MTWATSEFFLYHHHDPFNCTCVLNNCWSGYPPKKKWKSCNTGHSFKTFLLFSTSGSFREFISACSSVSHLMEGIILLPYSPYCLHRILSTFPILLQSLLVLHLPSLWTSNMLQYDMIRAQRRQLSSWPLSWKLSGRMTEGSKLKY